MPSNMCLSGLIAYVSLLKLTSTAFLFPHYNRIPFHTSSRVKLQPLYSFVSDGSDYSTSDSDYVDDDDSPSRNEGPGWRASGEDGPTIEEQPPPLSKNAANRFVAFVWDNKLDTQDRDMLDLHDDRVLLNTDHVMYCRKANLYNETFNYNSMVDVVWSYPLLSADLKRFVGHAICLDSSSLEHAKNFLANEPIIQSLTDGDISSIPLYRWRHIKDHTLRQDEGRDGMPTVIINIDREADEAQAVRVATNDEHIKYLIQSERVIQAGPLHVCTEEKSDPASVAVGNIVLMNAHNRSHAVEFAENDPNALAGLYETIRVHRYNNLDVTGKFVADDQFNLDTPNPVDSMKEALDHWGYPVEDGQTPWLNY